MSNLKENFDAVRHAINSLDAAMADALNQITSDFEQKLTDQESAFNTRIRLEQAEFAELKEKADEAMSFKEDVDSERLGVLDTSRLDRRMLFEKLKDRWEDLDAKEIEVIESVLNRKAVWV